MTSGDYEVVKEPSDRSRCLVPVRRKLPATPSRRSASFGVIERSHIAFSIATAFLMKRINKRQAFENTQIFLHVIAKLSSSAREIESACMCYARDNVRACKGSPVNHRPLSPTMVLPVEPSPWYQLDTTELDAIPLAAIAYLNNELVAMLSDTIDYHGMLWCPMVSCAISYRIHRYRDERMQTIQLDTTNLPSQTTDSAW